MIPKIQTRLNLLIKVIGIVLPLLGLVFVVSRMWSAGVAVLSIISLNQIVTIILIGGAVYAADNFLIVLAWHRLLKWFGEKDLSWRLSVAIYGRTQIAKYIPGNIFHFSSRHLMGHESGFEHASLLGAMVFEILGQLTAASLIALIGFFIGIRSAVSIIAILLILLAALASPIVIQYMLNHIKFFKGKLNLPPLEGMALLKSLLSIWWLYLAFFIISNVVFSGIVIGVVGRELTIPISILFVAFTISWLAGFIAPGAPAGMGVREAVMILVLSRYLGESSCILISLLSRFVTMTGDICFFVIGILFSKRNNAGEIGV
jgi:hypothetical protein